MAAQRLGAARVPVALLEWSSLSSFAVVIFPSVVIFPLGPGAGVEVGPGAPGAARGHFYCLGFILSVCIISTYPRCQGPSRA